jgi:hypothetical protein
MAAGLAWELDDLDVVYLDGTYLDVINPDVMNC